MAGSPATAATLRLPDGDSAADLATYLGRARQADPDGVARLVAAGDVLAAYVSPVHGGGGPTVLGLRVLRLGAPARLDATVRLAAVAVPGAPAAAPGGPVLVLPDERVPAAGWPGVSPPRGGWEPVGTLDGALLAERAAAGIAEVATGSPPGAGASAVAALRARVWGRPLHADLPDLPCGAAFAARVLGFLDPAAPVAVYRAGPWWRVTAPGGHVLSRRPPSLL